MIQMKKDHKKYILNAETIKQNIELEKITKLNE